MTPIDKTNRPTWVSLFAESNFGYFNEQPNSLYLLPANVIAFTEPIIAGYDVVLDTHTRILQQTCAQVNLSMINYIAGIGKL